MASPLHSNPDFKDHQVGDTCEECTPKPCTCGGWIHVEVFAAIGDGWGGFDYGRLCDQCGKKYNYARDEDWSH